MCSLRSNVQSEKKKKQVIRCIPSGIIKDLTSHGINKELSLTSACKGDCHKKE